MTLQEGCVETDKRRNYGRESEVAAASRKQSCVYRNFFVVQELWGGGCFFKAQLVIFRHNVRVTFTILPRNSRTSSRKFQSNFQD